MRLLKLLSFAKAQLSFEIIQPETKILRQVPHLI